MLLIPFTFHVTNLMTLILTVVKFPYAAKYTVCPQQSIARDDQTRTETQPQREK